MKYEILLCEGTEDLEEVVNCKMEDGWKPQGGVCVMADKNGNEWFYQAMVKE